MFGEQTFAQFRTGWTLPLFWRRSTGSSVFRVNARGRAFTLSPPPHPTPLAPLSPSLISNLASADVKQNVNRRFTSPVVWTIQPIETRFRERLWRSPHRFQFFLVKLEYKSLICGVWFLEYQWSKCCTLCVFVFFKNTNISLLFSVLSSHSAKYNASNGKLSTPVVLSGRVWRFVDCYSVWSWSKKQQPFLLSNFSTAVQNRIFPTALAHVSVVSEVKIGVVKCENVMVNGWIRLQGRKSCCFLNGFQRFLLTALNVHQGVGCVCETGNSSSWTKTECDQVCIVKQLRIESILGYIWRRRRLWSSPRWIWEL